MSSSKEHNNNKKIVHIDEALEYTGFGRYSYLLLLCTFMLILLKISALSSLSYVIPLAACEFTIDESTHGAINAISYFGEAICGPIWGTASDRYGRKKVMIIICILGVVCSILLTLSFNATSLLTLSFLIGLCVGSLTSLIVTTLCEFHSQKYRTPVVMFVGFCNNIDTILFPAVAMGIIPLDFALPMGSSYFKSWRLYLLLILTAPALFGVLLTLCTFESPKYLLSNISQEKALDVMKTIYSWNTGKEENSFPFTEFLPEESEFEMNSKAKNKRSILERFQNAMRGMAPLFKNPYRKRLILLLGLFFANGLTGCILSWMPQYFAIQSNYEELYDKIDGLTVCDIMNKMNSANSSTGGSILCSNLEIDSERFINSIIIGCASLGVNVASIFILRFIQKKFLLAFTIFSQGVFLLFAVFLPRSSIPLTLNVAFYLVSLYLIVALVSEAFSTNIRAFGMGTAIVASQVSPAISNLFFPSWLAYSCLQPFIVVGVINIVLSFGVLFINRILVPI